MRFLAQDLTRLNSKCQLRWFLSGARSLLSSSQGCWQNSVPCSCRTIAPLLLLGVRQDAKHRKKLGDHPRTPSIGPSTLHISFTRRIQFLWGPLRIVFYFKVNWLENLIAFAGPLHSSTQIRVWLSSLRKGCVHWRRESWDHLRILPSCLSPFRLL